MLLVLIGALTALLGISDILVHHHWELKTAPGVFTLWASHLNWKMADGLLIICGAVTTCIGLTNILPEMKSRKDEEIDSFKQALEISERDLKDVVDERDEFYSELLRGKSYIAELEKQLVLTGKETVDKEAQEGHWTATEQRGTPGHCVAAQVFNKQGKAIVMIEPHPNELKANRLARRVAAIPEINQKIIYMKELLTVAHACMLTEDKELTHKTMNEIADFINKDV